MTNDFDSEIAEIATKIKRVEGYLDCEKIVVYSIKKQLENRNNDENIIGYLQKLSAWFKKKIVTDQHNADCTNYRHAAGFVNTLLKMLYWNSWMKTINM